MKEGLEGVRIINRKGIEGVLIIINNFATFIII